MKLEKEDIDRILNKSISSFQDTIDRNALNELCSIKTDLHKILLENIFHSIKNYSFPYSKRHLLLPLKNSNIPEIAHLMVECMRVIIMSDNDIIENFNPSKRQIKQEPFIKTLFCCSRELFALFFIRELIYTLPVSFNAQEYTGILLSISQGETKHLLTIANTSRIDYHQLMMFLSCKMLQSVGASLTASEDQKIAKEIYDQLIETAAFQFGSSIIFTQDWLKKTQQRA